MRKGEITVFYGPMFSGKTDRLIDHLVRSQIAGIQVQAFKPDIDNRGEGITRLRSKNGSEFQAQSITVEHPEQVLDLLLHHVKLVGIDEIQFFLPGIIPVVKRITDKGVNIAMAGLPTDFRGEPFGPMPTFLAIAQFRYESVAVCTKRDWRGETCGRPATQTQRIVDGRPAYIDTDEPVVVVGGEELYEARCLQHHQLPRRRGRGS